MPIVTMRQLLEAGIHFGHQTRRWNPKMARYIYGQRNGIYILDLKKTMLQIRDAYVATRDAVARGGLVLFLGTKKQAQEAVTREAERCGMYYVNNRWLGGTLTNWVTIRKSIANLHQLEEMEENGKIEQFPKKERIMMRKQCARLNRNLCGIKNMATLPKVLFVVDAKKEAIAVREARNIGCICIGVVDTNCDPDEVDIPIPANDDAIRSVNLLCSIIADAVMEGRMRADKAAADELGGSTPPPPPPKKTLAASAEPPAAAVPAGGEASELEAPAEEA